MDALASLVFGIVIVGAIQVADVANTRRTPATPSWPAGVIATTGLGWICGSSIYLGALIGTMVDSGASSVQILTLYVERTFGTGGIVLLAPVMLRACRPPAWG
ncbi:MAG: branched-chain amino acid transport system II carrier protein [Comamonadaceae bacterium]|jgi:branched-subunit amino acid permease|nr:branched-chain amino acid transport system II carrier protein [Comamonadaceae bacterium]